MRISYLWNSDRTFVWSLAEGFAEKETNAGVLVQLVNFLIRAYGYQYESLGAEQFVKMIGRTIADHRELFDEPDRRFALVEVLEAFVDAGWPAARRLPYRLPEALR